MIAEYGGRVYNHAFRFLHSREEAEEAVQDIFMKIYRALPEFRGECALSTWIYRITVNTCLSRLEGRRKRPDRMDPEEGRLHRCEPAEPSPEEKIISKDMCDRMLSELEKLDPELSRIVILFYIDGLRYEEIAEVLRLPLGTVCTRIARARNALRHGAAPIISEIRRNT
jgi:RNA polymerase sigma-70 factor (ECF subfamily)